MDSVLNVAGALGQGGPPNVGDMPLPALRADIEFQSVRHSDIGPPSWTIHDPLQNRFFRIDDGTKVLLSYWNAAKTLGNLARVAERELGYQPSHDQLSALAQFLIASKLAESVTSGWRDVARQAEQSHPSILAQIIHGY